jgi:hypothetical protein
MNERRLLDEVRGLLFYLETCSSDVVAENLGTAVIPVVRRVERTLYWLRALSNDAEPEALTAQEDKVLAPWIWGILNGKPVPAGDFLRSLAEAAVRADARNYATFRPALIHIALRFPQYDDPDAGGFPVQTAKVQRSAP